MRKIGLNPEFSQPELITFIDRTKQKLALGIVDSLKERLLHKQTLRYRQRPIFSHLLHSHQKFVILAKLRNFTEQ
jgi:hypothetical protein